MSNVYIKIETIASGQPRPYADSEYIQVLEFTRDDGRIKEWLEKQGLPLIVPYYVKREEALAVARAFCPYQDSEDEGFNWASRRLVSFDRLEPTPRADKYEISTPIDRSDRWKIHVRAAFTD